MKKIFKMPQIRIFSSLEEKISFVSISTRRAGGERFKVPPFSGLRCFRSIEQLSLVILLAFTLFTPFIANSAPKSLPLPPHIFEWVQSSARAGYWFNKKEIYYGFNNGIIDKNRITVPIIKVYDDVQIDEVKTKRRWHDQSLAGYEILAGAAEYLEFNLSEKSVLIKRHEELDNTWTVLSSEMPNKRLFLNKMSEKNVDKIFYNAILDYAEKHKDEILERSLTKGKLPEEKGSKDKNGQNTKVKTGR